MPKPKPEPTDGKTTDAEAQADATTSSAEPVGPSVKARVLTGCVHGKPDDVVTLSAAEAEAAVAMGVVDTHPDAVAYAESLAG